MKKKILVILCAALLLLSAAACGQSGNENETNGDTDIMIPVGTGDNLGTDENGDPVTGPAETTPAGQDHVSESNPSFEDCDKTLYVWTAVATIRSATVIDSDNAVAWPTEGTTLKATGESQNWYRIEFEDKTCYIAKTVVGDYAKIQAMTAVDNEEIEISADVNVRSFPSAEGGDVTKRGALKAGTKVTRVAKGDTWSCILYTVVSETETTEDGKPVETVKQYFIINECIKDDAATEAVTE